MKILDIVILEHAKLIKIVVNSDAVVDITELRPIKDVLTEQ
jgi:hypothetical protein